MTLLDSATDGDKYGVVTRDRPADLGERPRIDPNCHSRGKSRLTLRHYQVLTSWLERDPSKTARTLCHFRQDISAVRLDDAELIEVARDTGLRYRKSFRPKGLDKPVLAGDSLGGNVRPDPLLPFPLTHS